VPDKPFRPAAARVPLPRPPAPAHVIEAAALPPSISLLRRPGDEGHRWVEPALAWLEANLDAPQAVSAARALLRREDLDEATYARAVSAALAWVERHEAAPPALGAQAPSNADARALLHDLLGRYDLDDTFVERLFTTTLAWLDRHGADEESDYILRALLYRGDLDGEPAAHARRAALAWLDVHGLTPEAQFALRALLRREELAGDEARRAIKAALAWLDLHKELDEATFVLPLVLGRDGLKKGEPTRVSAAALAWLERHGMEAEADFVHEALLRSHHISPDHQHRAGELALAWFRQAPSERQDRRASVVLSLLRNARRFDDSIVGAAVDEILRWLPGAALSPATHTAMLFELRGVARRIERVAQVRALAESAPVGTVVPKASRSEFRRLAEELHARAADTAAPVDVAWLRRALAETERQLDQRAAEAAVSALPGLLPLAARTGSEAFLEDAVALATDAMRAARLEPYQVAGTMRACERLLGAWPDRAEGERILAEIDPRPSSAGLDGRGGEEPEG
jgi:hypothetical protein